MLFCVTGDFAFSGQENQFEAIGMILEEICIIIKKRFPKVEIHPIFVPGNHDCDFEDENAGVRDALLASPKLDITNTNQLRACTGIQKISSVLLRNGRKSLELCPVIRIKS